MPPSLIEALNSAYEKNPTPDAIVAEIGDPLAKFLAYKDLTVELITRLWDRPFVWWSKHVADNQRFVTEVQRHLSDPDYRSTFSTYLNEELSPEEFHRQLMEDTWMIESHYHLIDPDFVHPDMEFPK